MAKGLKVGAVVQGLRKAVLEKGDFNKTNGDEVIRGKIRAHQGTEKGRKWLVDWDNPSKSTLVCARRLDVYVPPSEGSSDSSDRDSDSSDDDDAAGQVIPDPIPAGDPQIKDPLTPHGVKWVPTSVVSDDSFSRNRNDLRLKWPNDLPIENRGPVDFF